jgi:predicted RNA-binding Zn-ribbon protein involved in translation (DUF1610 family)
MIEIQCPSCGAKLQTPDDAVGSMVKCPQCATPITVAEPIYDAEAMPEAAPAPGGPAAAAAEGEERRPCPMCGEMIIATAAKCRYCGEIFDPTLRKAEAVKRGGSVYPEDEDLTTGEWAVAILCSGIGCIMGIVWMIQGKPKGKKMFAVSILVNIAWVVIRAMLEEASRR